MGKALKAFTVLFIFLLLVACNDDKNVNQDQRNNTESEHSISELDIGVIGKTPENTFEKVTFSQVDPESLKKAEYDAYFVTDKYFQELSQDKWVSVFSDLYKPVFFLNSNIEPFIFRVEHMQYDDGYPKATMNTGGFVKLKDQDGYKKWGYGDPDESTDVDHVSEWIFKEMFQDITDYLNDNQSLFYTKINN